MTIDDKIRKAVANTKLSGADLSAQTGIAGPIIRRIVRDGADSVPTELSQRLALALGIEDDGQGVVQ